MDLEGAGSEQVAVTEAETPEAQGLGAGAVSGWVVALVEEVAGSHKAGQSCWSRGKKAQ